MSWTAREWTPPDSARRPRERWQGSYWVYQPFSLTEPEWRIDPAVAAEAGRVERRIRRLKFHEAAGNLEAVSRYLLRSEAVSSSYIEGLRSNARDIVFEELKRLEHTANGTAAAGHVSTAAAAHPSTTAEVADNIAALTSAVERLGTAERTTWADIEQLQEELLPSLSTPGIRNRQNWVGGSDIHPGQAEFIPPTEQALVPAVEDLVEFMSGAAMGCLIQAGLVHAQFETLHPFADDDGRIGRALITAYAERTGTRIPRSDSSVWKILDVLRKLPASTVDVAARLTGTSTTSAQNALERLAAAGVLDRRSIGKGKRGFVSNDLFDLLNSTQRKEQK